MHTGEGKKDKDRRTVTQWVVMAISIAMAVYHLYFATIGFITEMSWRSGHLLFAAVLILLLYPAGTKHKKLVIVDYFLILLALIAGIYIIHQYPKMNLRIGDPLVMDIVMGSISTLIVLEITRRVLGWTLVTIALVFLLYCFVGPYFSGILSHRGFDYDRVITQTYMTLEGIHGIPLGVMVKYVYFFILFAGFLDATGAGKWFINFAYALTGRTRSGPALTAVISSGFMGSVSGSAVANTVATGSFTIPLMKKVGYKPEVAGAIEAAASTGGQLMPPIMGAGAFIISEWTGIPYRTIVFVSVIPAILYFLSVGFFVHIRALKIGIQKSSAYEKLSLKAEIKSGAHYLIAIFVLVYMLVRGYSPTYSVCLSLLTLIAISFLRKESRLTVSTLLEALVGSAQKAIPVSAACAAAGIVVGTVGLTGLGLKFSAMVISVAGGNWVYAVFLVMIASLFLGMGLPVTAAYVVLAVLAVPGLRELGLSALAAHLVVFWYSQDSNITPPVCLAAFAAAGIANAKPMETGFHSWALAKGLYIIPFLFVYTPLLLTEGLFRALMVAGLAAVGLFCFTVFLEGYMIRSLGIVQRFLVFLVTVSCFWPNGYVSLGGLLLLALLVLYQVMSSPKKVAEAH
jgi:TRAP transporter 4TM/12TM fusion protein